MSLRYSLAAIMLAITMTTGVLNGNPNNFHPLYSQIRMKNQNIPDYDLFSKAVKGYYRLKKEGKVKNEVLSVVDFRKSSGKKRLWIIDMKTFKVLHHTWVAHGRNSGDEFASKFSNRSGSYQSSLGFYLTGSTYFGKHGLSLYLHGQEKNFNSNARNRLVVLHGADYVSENFIKNNGRLGRSFGCPSIPMDQHETIIGDIKDQSCLFIYYPEEEYEQNSFLLNNGESVQSPKAWYSASSRE